MNRSLINLNLSRLSYAILAAFAQTIHDGFVAEVAVYATPNPLMAAFQTDIDALNAAIATWGVPGNRGSHADHLAMKAAANTVRDDLRQLSDYAQNTTPDDPDSWTAVGFKTKRAKSAPVVLQMVQNLRNFISRAIPAPGIKLKWKRPFGSNQGDVKGYVIQRSNAPAQPAIDGNKSVANVIGIVTSTSFVDADPFVGANYYWVTPFNTLGYGVSSGQLMVISTKLA